MKKILFAAIVVMFAITASAQVEQGFRHGIQVNVGVSKVCYEVAKASIGYGAGWVAEYNVNSKLYLQSGIGIQNISHKNENIDGTLNAYFIQLPIHVGYRFELGDTKSVFIQAGPTLGYGISGTKLFFYEDNESYDYFDSELFKRFDLGVGGRVGMAFNNIQVSLGANYGVLKSLNGIKGGNLSANIGVAYMF